MLVSAPAVLRPLAPECGSGYNDFDNCEIKIQANDKESDSEKCSLKCHTFLFTGFEMPSSKTHTNALCREHGALSAGVVFLLFSLNFSW